MGHLTMMRILIQILQLISMFQVHGRQYLAFWAASSGLQRYRSMLLVVTGLAIGLINITAGYIFTPTPYDMPILTAS